MHVQVLWLSPVLLLPLFVLLLLVGVSPLLSLTTLLLLWLLADG
jgi:hypothetical protein